MKFIKEDLNKQICHVQGWEDSISWTQQFFPNWSINSMQVSSNSQWGFEGTRDSFQNLYGRPNLKKNRGRVRCEICSTWYQNLLPSYTMIVLEDVLRCIGGGISKWINGMKYSPDIDSWIYGSFSGPQLLSERKEF